MPFITVTPADLADLEGPAKVMARAKGGTIVLDEVTDLDADSQGRVVRMMDAPGDHAPHFMATSQARLSDRLEGGRLREDLYYRLSGAVIEVPSLRERVEDIPLLAAHFLARAEREGNPPRALSEGAEELMRAYSWPGNVRQLENAVRRIGLTARSEEISRAEVEAVLGNQPAAQPVLGQGDGEKLSASVARHLQRYFDLHGNMLPPPGLYPQILREVEAPLIEIALDATGETRRNAPICWGSTEIRCERRSRTLIFS